jgi:hypothetical protein
MRGVFLALALAVSALSFAQADGQARKSPITFAVSGMT